MAANPVVQAGRNKPKKRWLNIVKDCEYSVLFQIKEARELTTNRREWKTFIKLNDL